MLIRERGGEGEEEEERVNRLCVVKFCGGGGDEHLLLSLSRMSVCVCEREREMRALKRGEAGRNFQSVCGGGGGGGGGGVEGESFLFSPPLFSP